MKNLAILSMLVLGFACTSTPKEEAPVADTTTTVVAQDSCQDSCATVTPTVQVEAAPTTTTK